MNLLDTSDSNLKRALPRAFFLDETLTVAQRLLNCLVVTQHEEGLTVGRISETEAYRQDDPACHAFVRKTARNAPLFGPPGHAYVHLNYGVHWCLNAVTQPEGQAEGVLIRALEPLSGVELMATRRGLTDMSSATLDVVKRGRFLCGGPGKLTVALGIGPTLNNIDLTEPDRLWIAPPLDEMGYVDDLDIVATVRVGITRGVEYPWRFYKRDDPYISKK